jgi:hypothetical protein
MSEPGQDVKARLSVQRTSSVGATISSDSTRSYTAA